MDFKDKAELRAFLEKEMSSAQPVSTRRGMRPASSDEYARALTEIESSISPAQRQMLVGHALAPGQVLTMTQLAALAGYDQFQVANSQYGSLGGKLIAALGIPSPKWKVYAIASFDDNPETGESRAHMYPELLEALQQLGWIAAGESTQTQAKSAPRQPSDAGQPAPAAHDSMLSTQEVIATLESAGFARPAQSGLKVVRLEHPGLVAPVFVKQSSSIHARLQAPLVLHPQYEDKLVEWLSISGLERGDSRYYHNSNLRGFPKRLNSGATEIAYGVDLGFHHLAALEEVISRLLGQPQATAAVPGVQEASISPASPPDDLAVTDTEREALIKARIGQSDYRDALLAYWGGCAVTDCTITALLRASHIKPWRAASASERLDPYNGLLLIPNLDLAFDQGLISFDDLGQILFSPDLDPDSARALNLHSHLRLRQIEARHRGYLAWHRDNLFRK